MGLTVLTAPTPILSYDEAVKHCRLLDASESGYVEMLIAAATEVVEGQTRRSLGTQTLLYTADSFPCSRVITLEKPPLVSVTHVKYIDDNGSLQTLNSTLYTVDIKSLKGRICLNEGNTWPVVGSFPNAVQVTYVAGAASNAVPADLKLLILFLVEHWYLHRSPVPIVGGTAEVPYSLTMMLNRRRIY